MTGIARRSVLRGAAVAALVPLAIGGVAAVAAERPATAGTGERRALEAAVGSKVRIAGQEGSVTATVHVVRDLNTASAGDERAFSVVFHLVDGDARVLRQGLVDIDLPASRVAEVGLVLADPEGRTAVLDVDRRPVSEHVAARRIHSS